VALGNSASATICMVEPFWATTFFAGSLS